MAVDLSALTLTPDDVVVMINALVGAYAAYVVVCMVRRAARFVLMAINGGIEHDDPDGFTSDHYER